ARSCLKHDQWKLTVPLASDHFLRGAHNQVDLFLGQLAQLAIRQRGAFFQNPQGADHWAAPAESLDADRKSQTGALGLRTPQVLGRDFDRAERVLLDARRDRKSTRLNSSHT